MLRTRWACPGPSWTGARLRGKGRPIQRTIVLAVAASSLVSVLLTVLVMTLTLPAAVDAQATRIQAERVAVVGPTGAELVLLGAGPGAHASVNVRNTEGRVRAAMATGGSSNLGGVLPDAAGFNLFASDGTAIGRWGTRGTGGTYEPGVVLRLSDMQGRARMVLEVAPDGTPSMQMLDAAGTVTWRAQ
jgi:hypothetical protein